MTRSIVAQMLGPPDNYAIEEGAMPTPGSDEVRVATRFAGVAFVDALVASGRYQIKPPTPFVPGSEMAGVIDAVGKNVPDTLVGKRVCGILQGGAFSERCILPANEVFLLPDAMSFQEGAVFGVSYATALHGLVDRGALEAGETMLVLGAGGAVGLAAVQIGKALGATVIASASTDEKRALAIAAGADAVVPSRDPAWRDHVKAALGKRSLDLVFDPVSGDETEAAFRCLGWNGRHLIVGFASGVIARLPVNLPLLKGASLVGVDFRKAIERDPALKQTLMSRLFALFEQGALRPAIGSIYQFADFAAAMIAAANGGAGRIVLQIGPQ